MEEDSAAQRDCGGFLESVEANCGMLVKESALKDRDVCIGVLSALRELNNTVNQRLLEASKLLNSVRRLL